MTDHLRIKAACDAADRALWALALLVATLFGLFALHDMVR